MLPIAQHTRLPVDPASRARPKAAIRPIEKFAIVASLTVVAFFACVEVVRTAAPDAPVVQATFDVAPSDSKPLLPAASERWYADESAQGTAPNASH